MPVLVLLANTGIVMLYGDSITRWLDPEQSLEEEAVLTFE